MISGQAGILIGAAGEMGTTLHSNQGTKDRIAKMVRATA